VATRDAYSLVPPYLRTDGDAQGVGGLPWFSELGLQQTRGFRALKVWGDDHPIWGSSDIDRPLRTTSQWPAALADGFVRPPTSSCGSHPRLVSCASATWATGTLGTLSPDVLDALNRALVTELQLGGEVFPTSTVPARAHACAAVSFIPRRRPTTSSGSLPRCALQVPGGRHLAISVVSSMQLRSRLFTRRIRG